MRLDSKEIISFPTIEANSKGVIGVVNNSQKEKERISLTYKDATTNTIIIGATGAGKTKGVILPILNSFIKDGLPGIVLDVKNDFTKYVKLLARKHGRETDIVEIGSYKEAEKINILNGLDKKEIKNLLREILSIKKERGEDVYWERMGLRVLDDIIDVLFFIKENSQEELPITFYLLYQIIVNPSFAMKIWQYFNSLPNSKEKERLTRKIKSYKFHVFNQSGKKDSTDENNRSWTYQRFSNILENLIEGSFLDNFSYLWNMDFKLDFKKLLYEENKIIIFRFDPLSDTVAQLIGAFAQRKMVQDIVKYNTNIPEEERKYIFNVIDEFQQIFLSEKEGFNNLNWIAQSRSFKCLNVFATQTISSLQSKVVNFADVRVLLGNCRNKIFLSNEDSETQKFFEEITSDYDNVKKLYSLKLGEGYFYKYTAEKGEKILKLIQTDISLYENLKGVE